MRSFPSVKTRGFHEDEAGGIAHLLKRFFAHVSLMFIMKSWIGFYLFWLSDYLVHAMSQIVRVGKRNAVYLPRSVTEALGIKEGDKLRVMVRDNTIVMRPLPRLFEKRRYWASTTIEEFEAESEELIEDIEREGKS